MVSVALAVVPVPVREKTLKSVELPSRLAAPGACTLMAVSTPEARCHASSGYKEIIPKRCTSNQNHQFRSDAIPNLEICGVSDVINVFSGGKTQGQLPKSGN